MDNEILPGITEFPESLLEALSGMKSRRGADYKPRTHHLEESGEARYTNRLFLESSPYLLQHAHNPVNWYPWGEEAFEAARKHDQPVLVSIGYSTCHWCHVMEEESFEDVEIARYLNSNYIAVKIDREERPDIDGVYMTAVQAMTGSGGWPLNVWLTPDGKPFWGGTYFPARDGDRGASMGFLTILKRIKEAYKQNRGEIDQTGKKLTDSITRYFDPDSDYRKPQFEILEKAILYYRNNFDAQNGGLGRAPKFPSTLPVELLLRIHRRTGSDELLRMVTLTLKKMAAGGMYDQVAGGFHRYSTDVDWLVPHFEKMLYDNALLVNAYSEAYQVTRDPDFEATVHEILQYVEREMTSPESLFYSATDADSLNDKGERDEGYYFTWTPAELDQVLGKERSTLVQAFYNVRPGGNFEGRSILHRKRSKADIALGFGLAENELSHEIDLARKQLYDARNLRDLPIRDDKILTSWNGLMISAFARAGFILNQPAYLNRATRSADAIIQFLSADKGLSRSYKDGETKQIAFLEDYSFLIKALLDLFEADFNVKWLRKAVELDRILEEEFEDKEKGGFFMTAASGEKLIAREKPHYDNALPSGNSVTMLNLQRLATLTGDDSYRQRFQKSYELFLGGADSNAVAQAEMLKALESELDQPREIVLIIPENRQKEGESYLEFLRMHYLPNSVLVVSDSDAKTRELAEMLPLVRGRSAVDGAVTAFICEKGTCSLPVTDLETFKRHLSIVHPLPEIPF